MSDEEYVIYQYYSRSSLSHDGEEEGDCPEFEHSVAVQIFNFLTDKIKADELFSGRLLRDFSSSSDNSIHEHSIELNKRKHWMHLQKKYTKRFSNFEEFLSKLVPSHLIRSGIIGWIVLAPRDFLLHEDFVWASEVYIEWKRLVEEKACVNLPLIQDLAKKHNIFSGKWMIFQPDDVHADLTWIRIARAHEEGKLGVAARISLKPLRKQNSSDQVIYVYNDDFRDEKTVFELEKKLRDTGIRCTMFYKPLVFTYCDIFSGNEWGIKAFIYMSTYDVKNKSTIVQMIKPMAVQMIVIRTMGIGGDSQ